MTRYTPTVGTIRDAGAPQQHPVGLTIPPEILELLQKVEGLLQDGQPAKALDALARTKTNSPWLANARGVCQLRLGKPTVAVDVFRGIVLAPGGIHLRSDAPTVFKTNFAIALLQSGNLEGCMSTLFEIRKENHPTITRLSDSIGQWKQSLTFAQKLAWYFGNRPARPVTLDFPVGDLR
jgi:hypothetical protein